MENGAIVEQGTHQDLLAQKGYYADLYARQQQLEERPDTEGEE
jgi:ABC-type multidrug transport system fused ATPase/permease subunit